jgi:hypothetical protein
MLELIMAVFNGNLYSAYTLVKALFMQYLPADLQQLTRPSKGKKKKKKKQF